MSGHCTILKQRGHFSVQVLCVVLSALSVFTSEAKSQQNDINAAILAARNFVLKNPGWTLAGKDQAFKVTDVISDRNGARHVRFDRSYKNLNVIGGDFIVHSDRAGNFVNSTMTLQRELNVSVTPLLSAEKASSLAMQKHAGTLQNVPSRLVIYARGDSPVLAWDILLSSTNLDGTPSEKHVMVDANLGRILETWEDIHTASVQGAGKGYMVGSVSLTTDFTSSIYYLRDPDRGNQYTINMKNRTSGGSIYSASDNTWGDGTLSNVETVGTDAQFGAARTWDFFKVVLGRQGIANDGVGAYSRVHYGSKYNNAFWSDRCFCMTYGDGDGSIFNPFVALDVAGHEISHGVTSRTAKLTYSGESGGLNEGTSDIFGTMVEYYANISSDSPDYLIGEKLYKSGGKALRYMYQPSLDQKSADCWYSGVGNLDVHYSSGVANHFFYLLAEGTSPTNLPKSPTCQAGNTRVATGSQSFVGIKKDKAAKIWYRALTTYMTSNSNYSKARAATLKATSDLISQEPALFSSADYDAVNRAWSLVLVLN